MNETPQHIKDLEKNVKDENFKGIKWLLIK